jgi:hypothetical protein
MEAIDGRRTSHSQRVALILTRTPCMRNRSSRLFGGTVCTRHAIRVNQTGIRCQRRVKFDFEVDFSNGGALQGQAFRLDIEGEDISEEELARYIVEDMRLLMVQEVRILNKEIISERHMRVDPS